jgi:pimeloyl-ACP methyl ester carboxylesterase
MKTTLVAVMVATGLAAVGAVVYSPAGLAHADPNPEGYVPPAISWGTCVSPGLQQRGAECGFVTVPLDYADSAGKKIKLAVSRIKHTSPDYQGVMLTNPGGPGQSGLTLSVLGEFVPGGVGSEYDWIGFDPRGVGSSQPSLTCDGDIAGYNRPDYVPTTKALERTWLAKDRDYAEACATAGGDLLDHVKTTDNVEDMESIRKALGADQISYYGLSYGTYLGQVYATEHPDHIHRMVLDGVVNPTRVWYGSQFDQDVQFYKNEDVFFAWVAKYDSVYHLGTTGAAVKAKYSETQKSLASAPAEGKIGPDEWGDIFLSAGYYVFGWEDVASAFAAWVNDGDAAPLVALYPAPGPAADNGYAMYLATSCTDAPWPQSWATWEADSRATNAKAPFLAWSNTWFNEPCREWGAKAGRPVGIDGADAPPVLLISETNDAATPFSGALEVRQRFPRSVLIEGVGGTTHAGSLNGVACTDNAVADYLSAGTLPKRVQGNRSDAQCDPVPQPDPTATAGKLAPFTGAGAAVARIPARHNPTS